MFDISSIFYIACVFIFVFGIFNGTSRDVAKVKKSALKALALVTISLIFVALI